MLKFQHCSAAHKTHENRRTMTKWVYYSIGLSEQYQFHLPLVSFQYEEFSKYFTPSWCETHTYCTGCSHTVLYCIHAPVCPQPPLVCCWVYLNVRYNNTARMIEQAITLISVPPFNILISCCLDTNCTITLLLLPRLLYSVVQEREIEGMLC